jgi:cell division protein FtsN
MAVAAVALTAFAAFSWYAYDRATRPGGEVAAPLIKAEEGPTRVRPETPGGMEVPHQDKLVYERLARGGPEPESGRLLPPPETLLPRPMPAPAAGPGTGAAKVEVLIGPVQPPKPPIRVEDAPTAPAERPSAPALAPAAGPETSPRDADEGADVAPPEPPTGPETGEGAGASKEVALAAPEPPAPPTAAPEAPASLAAGGPAQPKTEVATAVPGPEAAAGPAGAYRVQMGAFRSRDAAERERTRLTKTYPDLLGSLSVTVESVDVGAKGVFHRVRGGPLTKQAAAELCAELQRHKAGCFVVKR